MWPFVPKPVPQPVRMPRTAPRAQRRTVAEHRAFDAMTAQLRAEQRSKLAWQREIEMTAYLAVARELGQPVGGR